MSYIKPQTPLQHKDGDYFYPLTTIDQVIMEDGITRLNGADLVSVNTDGAPEGETVKVNADTLGGKPENELSVAKAVDSDTLGGISADEYAKLSDLENVSAGMTMELLWENASPNSGFVPQTLNLDFSDAEFAFVEPNVGYGVFVRKGKICGASASNVWAVGENAGNCHFRQITLYDSNIAFDRGVVLSFTAGSAIESNDAWIPVRIYKVKGVSA